jgi:hypothetical protein
MLVVPQYNCAAPGPFERAVGHPVRLRTRSTTAPAFDAHPTALGLHSAPATMYSTSSLPHFLAVHPGKSPSLNHNDGRCRESAKFRRLLIRINGKSWERTCIVMKTRVPHSLLHFDHGLPCLSEMAHLFYKKGKPPSLRPPVTSVEGPFTFFELPILHIDTRIFFEQLS